MAELETVKAQVGEGVTEKTTNVTLSNLVEERFNYFLDQFLNTNLLLEAGVICAGLIASYVIAWGLRRGFAQLLPHIEKLTGAKIPNFTISQFGTFLLIGGAVLFAAHVAFANVGVITPIARVVGAVLLGIGSVSLIKGFNPSLSLMRWARVIGYGGALLLAFGLLGPLIGWLDQAGFSLGDKKLTITDLIKMTVLVIAFFAAALFASRFFRRQINQVRGVNPSLKVLFSNIINVGLLCVAGIMTLNLIGIDLTALAVFSGALGVGIGFGLQKIISNFVSGIILLLDRSLKPGDVIEIETGHGTTYGWVETLGLRYTSVTTRDGTETLIPNETFITNPVTNWSYSHSKVRRKLPIGIAYDTDVEKAMELCIEAAKSVPRVIDDPAPVCQLRGFGDSSVNLELRFWLGDPSGGVRNVESQVNMEIWKLFREHGIEIPFPQQDITIRNLKDLVAEKIQI